VKRVGWLAAVVVVLAGGYALILQSGWLNLSLAQLEARYKTPQSKFAEIDGVRLHYMDEGQGPVVVLLHASFMSLRFWDLLAADLLRGHRVIRLDFPTAGLTGPDPRKLYSMERNGQLLEQLLTRLNVERFALVGTSSGGIVAFRYAAAHPERVTRLILVNSAGMPRSAATDPNRPQGTAISRWIEQRYKSRAYWQGNLERQFGSGVKPPDAIVQMVYDFNRREGLADEGRILLKNFRTGDPEATLGQVKAPTLVLWGMGNITVSHLEADVFEHWLTAAPSMKKKYPAVGHYCYLEIPQQFNADISEFLDGKLDASLRRSARLPL
jgi:pimeloyl-ACP methyl ester carboxylesterase